MTLIEVIITLSILVVASSIFCQMLLAGRRMRQTNRENALAADAARVVVERMHNAPFLNVYRDYNEDPKDDPLGNGTGPGSTFAVEGLEPVDGSPHGHVGRIYLPSRSVEVQADGGAGGGKLGAMGGGGAGATVIEWHLREDIEDDSLGLPRDLNGNNIVDEADHSSDYILLPVRIRIEWRSGNATRRFELTTQLCDFPLEEEGP
jgi:hypothetical protein